MEKRKRNRLPCLTAMLLLAAVLLSGCADRPVEPEPTAEPEFTTEPTVEPEITPTVTPPPAEVTEPAEPEPTAEPEDPALLALWEILREAEPGDTVLFGRYEQDAKEDNGAEEISWIVLAKEDGRVLLLSEYALDIQCFNEKNDNDVAWEQSTLRAWLNGYFFETAFNETEKQLILESVLQNADNPDFPREAPDTEDRVFLLSVGELMNWLPQEKDRVVYATAYAERQGVVYYDGRCWWWTRSVGSRPGNTSYVNTGGVFVHEHVSSYKYAVRPAIWCGLGDE